MVEGQTTVIHRAKHDFEYRPGETVRAHAVFVPRGKTMEERRRDEQIIKHLCYEERILVDNDQERIIAVSSAPPVQNSPKRGSRRKTA